MAKWVCRLHSRERGLGLMRPHTQFSFELWVWAEPGSRRLETRVLPSSTL